MSILSNLKPPAGAKRPHRRPGRGPGSGNGKTCGRGQKGQGSRSGSGGMLYFEGGQMPLVRRVPKRGFRNTRAAVVRNLDVSALECFDNGAAVTLDLLRERRLVRGRFDKLKVLGSGELSKKLTVQAHAFSAGARAKIEQAGGAAIVLPPKGAAARDQRGPKDE